MLTLIRRRLMQAIPTLLLVSLLTFFLGYFAPGSPIDSLLGPRADRETRQRLEHEYGLDRPALVQYGSFLWNALHGDLGRSFVSADRTVTEIIADHFPTTAFLASMAMAMACLLGLPAGLCSALQHNRLTDRLVTGSVLVALSVPTFVSAPILMLVLALWLGWLPTSGWEGPAYYVMPVLVLAAQPAALLARFMRASMLEVIRQEYITTARAKGLSPTRIITRHALQNAFPPVLTVLGTNFGALLTGSFVVEVIFRIPGIGYESVASILRRDCPVIQGVALLVAVIFLAVNLAVDLLYSVIDPRIRCEGTRG